MIIGVVMAIYRIADLNVEINPKFEISRKRLEPYAVLSGGSEKSPKVDISISVSDDEILERTKLGDGLNEKAAEDALILTKFCNAVLDGFDGFFFHSSCLELDGEAYIFSAVSGTGKSTHTALWRKHFGNRVTMINDDKPIIRKRGGKFYAYGTPWMGKADIGTNTKAPIKAVYILQRAEKNSAIRVAPSQVMKQLFEATVIDVERSRMEKLLELLNEFLSTTPLFLLSCNMDESAVSAAFNAVNGT